VKQYYTTAYASNLGRWTAKWECVAKETTVRTHLLANLSIRTIQKDQVDVPVQWTNEGTYTFEELRGKFIEAVNHDDDCMTQFVEREALLKRLNKCQTFQQLIDVWDWMSEDPMSFDLAVWHSDSPITNEEAANIYMRLSESQLVSEGQSSDIEAFYRDLIARWPEIDTVPEDRVNDVESCPWSRPLVKSGRHIIMSVGRSKADEVSSFVYELALKHGLVHFDPLEGRVDLPAHLKPKRSRPWFRFW